MKGVMSPGVSAGSKNVGASVKWVASVSWPSGAACAGAGAPASASVSSGMATYRACCLMRPPRASAPRCSGIQDHLEGIARALLQDIDGLVHARERELVRDERFGREPAGCQQREGTANAGAPFAALRVDGDVAPDG